MQSAKVSRVLYMEDDKGIAALMRRKLERAGYEVALASDGAEGLEMCESSSWDAIIVDHKMPRFSGLDVIRRLAQRKAMPASIMITGAGDETVAVEALKLGASDYVIKDVDGRFLELMPSVIEQAISKQRLMKEKELAEEKLRQAHDELEKRVVQRTEELEASNQRLRKEIQERIQIQASLEITESRLSAIFNTAKDCIFLKDVSLRYVLVNPHMAKLLEIPTGKILGRKDEELFGSEAAGHMKKVDFRVLQGETIEEEHTRVINSIPMTFLDVKSPMRDVQGIITGICGISRNITDRSGTQPTLPVTADDYPSAVMQAAMNKARLAAETDSLVLLTGESGTGKDYLARFIHKNSKRSSGPFYVINCAAVSEELAESELFGHETGAFTGAQRRKRGLLELAEGGTILLNEIGEMSLRLQAKLLTFLETKTFTRVGGEKTITVDARLIAATNRNLSEEVSEGRFRKDLFYRLDVLEIRVPLLRERSDDIPLLVQQILSSLAAELHFQTAPEIDSHTFGLLRHYSWPGNVRELRNLLERAIILSRGRRLELKHFGLTDTTDSSAVKEDRSKIRQDYNELIRQLKLTLIQDALNKCGGRRYEAARLLGLTRDALKRQMTTLGMLGQTDS